MEHLSDNTILQGGRYRIESILGRGGFGITYLAVQSGLERRVAIKEFFMKELCGRDDTTGKISIGTQGGVETVERYREKFLKEARNLARLNHPHIVRVIDVFEENGTAYYVMEYAEKGSLAQVLKRDGFLPEPVATHYICQIADALRYIHECGINHLDVKPANIMLNEKNEAVLIDFGLSKQYTSQGNQTSSTPVGVSEGFAPLEQYDVSGLSAFSPETDIYALGATFYKLLTGQTPPKASLVNEDGLPLEPLHKHGVSETAINLILHAMEPRRKQRLRDAAEFLHVLDGAPEKMEAQPEPAEAATTPMTGAEPAPVAAPGPDEDHTVPMTQTAPQDGTPTRPKGEVKAAVQPIIPEAPKPQGAATVPVMPVTPEPSPVGGDATTPMLENPSVQPEAHESATMPMMSDEPALESSHESATVPMMQDAPAASASEQKGGKGKASAKSSGKGKKASKQPESPEQTRGDAKSASATSPSGTDEKGGAKRKSGAAGKIILLVVVMLLLFMSMAACAVGAWFYFKDKPEVEDEVVTEVFDEIDGHEYVDLALPSGTLWATCNLGASAPQEYGSYFAWGETAAKDYFDWDGLAYCNGHDYEGPFTKYVVSNDYGVVDDKSELEPGDDAATAQWGGQWHMPSREQFAELCDTTNCKWVWATIKDVNGFQVSSVRNGNSIFLPAAGYRNEGLLNGGGMDGHYASRSICSEYSSRFYALGFSSTKVDWYYCYRAYGLPIRPVSK